MSNPYTDATREIRVFLSSTFKDTQAERNHLIKHVFPPVRERCAERGVGFTEIDLRWGVTEEEAKNGTTVAICLSEIDRCRGFPPFFIGFLGERYGWVPHAKDLQNYLHHEQLDQYREQINNALEQQISVTELEFQYALKGHENKRAESLFFLRDKWLTDQLFEASGSQQVGDFYDTADGKLERLKQQLRDAPSPASEYASIEDFGERIKQHLLDELERRYPARENVSPLLEIQRQHQRFAQARKTCYVPLTNVRSDLTDYCTLRMQGIEQHPCLISGVSGVGKSALMADLAEHLQQTFKQAQVHDFYIGADGQHRLAQWRDYLWALLGGAPEPQLEPGAFKDEDTLWDNFQRLLHHVAASNEEQPLILLLDAINQLDTPEQDLHRLLELNLPANVILILSATDDLAVESQHVWPYRLNTPDRAQLKLIIEAYTRNFRKGLPHSLVERLSDEHASPYAALPLYLRVLLEELRVRATHETLAQQVETLLTYPSVGTLFQHILGSWDTDLSDSRLQQPVTEATRYIALTRGGLDESQLARVLTCNTVYVEPNPLPAALPRQQVSLILAILRPFLLRHDGAEQLMHGTLQSAVLKDLASRTRRLNIALTCDSTAQGITEQVYQYTELLKHNSEDKQAVTALTTLLNVSRNVVDCFRIDRSVLFNALSLLGASLNTTAQPAHLIAEGWKNPDLFKLAGTVEEIQSCNEITHLFIDLNFFHLCDAWIATTEQLVREHFADEPLLSIMNRGNRADLFVRQGRYQEAEQLDLALLQAYKGVLADDDPQVAICWFRIANAKYRLGQQQEATHAYRTALDLQRKAYPEGDRQLVITYCSLGVLNTEMDDLVNAEQCYSAALEMAERVLSPKDIVWLNVLVGVSELYYKKGAFEEAHDWALQTLELATVTLPAVHQMRAKILAQLAAAVTQLNRPAEAAEYLIEAIGIASQASLADAISLPIMTNNLTYVLCKQGLLEDAGQWNARTWELVKDLPEGHPEHKRCLDNAKVIAVFLAEQEDSSLRALFRHLAPTDDETEHLNQRVIELNNSAVQYKDWGRLQESEAYFLEALQLASRDDAFDRGDLASIKNGLAALRWDQHRHEEAVNLYLDVLKMRIAHFSDSHPSVGQSLQTLGDCYVELEHWERALNALGNALKIYHRTPPENLEMIAVCLSSFAMAQYQLGDLPHARESATQALTFYQRQRPVNAQVVERLTAFLQTIRAQMPAKSPWWKFW
ncbi:tetratricopeptide repeat protein [Pseudomonas sp. CCC3.1]|uniref:tetratricopeptide repeat protein n=3 Tax=unclassified Pseudomonas TaxID=196821 RepID=UPI002AC98800|nr:tetratricopeptide repeat protein [Pseudomonas sp. CCC3.1]MEB0207678.1 tetratricopeptide repeat protein [Pseudomonas sp. CCC3.1]WPX34511.1 tetratricopeptide repeat protein [Pseudomonas sp. CCC3.1]